MSTLQFLTNRIAFLQKIQELAIKDGDTAKQLEVTMILCELLDVKINLTKELYRNQYLAYETKN